jgi:hypothetical protein
MKISGSRGLALALLLLAGACIRYGFAGGGLPQNIRSVAVLPFENETAQATLTQELHDRLRREVGGRLGLREAPEGRADAIVRGRIADYTADIPVGYSADRAESSSGAARRRLQITVDVEIVDQANDRTLWSRRGLSADADYNERSEADGRRQAIEKLVNEVISGAQSQW